jgi:AraC family transcriptional regulator
VPGPSRSGIGVADDARIRNSDQAARRRRGYSWGMTQTEQDWRERIGAAQQVIEERLNEDVPLEELARAAHYSLFHFHRLFRAVTGETVRAYTRRLRLERAAYRLTHDDADILRIALDAGYDSHEAFTRAFKSCLGTTPSDFREQRREVRARRDADLQEQTMDIRIEKRAPVRIACVRHVGPYDQVGGAWGKLMKWGWSRMIFRKAQTFGLCYDDPEVTPPDRIRYEACMTVDAKAKPKGDVQIRDLPAGTYAVALHEGPYEGLGKTYAALCARIASGPIDDQTWALADPPSLEKYLNDPRKTKPEDLRTEVWYPVQA